MPPACLPWMSSDSTCPCTCSAGLWCVVMCRRKGSSRPLVPTTSTWPCCWSSSSCPLCLPSTPSSPSPLPLTVDPLGNDASSFNLPCTVWLLWLSIVPFSLVGKNVCLMWSRRRLCQTSLPGSVKRSVMPLTLGWCYPSCCWWCESANTQQHTKWIISLNWYSLKEQFTCKKIFKLNY